MAEAVELVRSGGANDGRILPDRGSNWGALERVGGAAAEITGGGTVGAMARVTGSGLGWTRLTQRGRGNKTHVGTGAHG